MKLSNPRHQEQCLLFKAYDEPYVNYATKVMLENKKITDFDFNPKKGGFAIKVPIFSFNKFPNVNKELGLK